MKVKKYTSDTMPEVMNLVRKELGPDAVILNSKEVRSGGVLGFFKKKKIEVFAGLDEQPLKRNSNPSKHQKHEPLITKKPVMQKVEQPVLNEINYLKKLIEKQSVSKYEIHPPSYQLMYDYLLQQEVNQSTAYDIIMQVKNYHTEHSIDSTTNNVMDQTQLELETRLGKLASGRIKLSKKVIQFVGPTGVGKTTTLAKVAAKLKMEEHKKIAFITLDTYRIAAIDQLKTYAKILNVPIEVAYSDDDYKNALYKFSAYDLILVDTAGRNFREEKYISDIKKISKFNNSIESYLVLSLTAKQKDLYDIQKLFSDMGIKALIFTKLDETTQYGSILSIAEQMNKSVAYITNGQDVPDDLMIPFPKNIAELIIEDYINE